MQVQQLADTYTSLARMTRWGTNPADSQASQTDQRLVPESASCPPPPPPDVSLDSDAPPLSVDGAQQLTRLMADTIQFADPTRASELHDTANVRLIAPRYV